MRLVITPQAATPARPIDLSVLAGLWLCAASRLFVARAQPVAGADKLVGEIRGDQQAASMFNPRAAETA